MKRPTERTFRAIYRLLDRVSPLDADCGQLCGAACCTSAYEDGEEMGIFLLPGEEQLHSPDDSWLDWSAESAADLGFPDSWTGDVCFVHCKTPPHCPREKRPIQCRTFPLAPHLSEDGELTLVYNDLDLPYRCPLIDGQTPLNDNFVQATQTVWEHLIRDPRIRDMVREDSIEREQAILQLQEMLGF
ncbi:MAG: hypothetical protein K5772_05185 [Clostridia bacterium]|nr:hypothetical protein [Clostridia bacterium]